MKKKILSGVLAVALLFGSAASLPEGVFETSSTITASAEGETSGKIGDNVKWSLKNGVLTISGKGKMTDHASATSPFFGNSDIKSVVIKSGVTNIGGGAFIGCSNLKDITIPSSVTSIDYYSFMSCTSLTSVTIPSSVTSIGLKAFFDCTRLANITIPKSVTSIGLLAFAGTKWNENQQKKDLLVVVNGILTDGCACKGKVTIPSSIKSIGDGAFYNCSNITSVTIPDSVTSIGTDAFCGCNKLKDITIPNSVTSIGENAFYGCLNLTSITIPNGVTKIAERMFAFCSSLTSVTIPSSVTSIDWWAFMDCKSLKSVTIPKGVKSIGEHAFGYEYDSINYEDKKISDFTIYGYKGTAAEKYAKKNGFAFEIVKEEFEYKVLKDGTAEITKYNGKGGAVTIPSTIGGKKVTSIGDYVFNWCTSVESITIPKSVKSLGAGAFAFCEKLKSVTIPSSVTSIGMDAFYGCKSLESITIPSNVKSMGINAFYSCTSLKSVTIQDGITTIEGCAFHSCTSLKNVTIPNSVTSIGNDAFFNCTSLESITIPNSVTSIINYAFCGCKNLKSVTIPSSVTSIGEKAFGYYPNKDNTDYIKVKGFTIYGVKGTAAEKYAKDNGFKFVAKALPKQTRFAGANRYDTAALISKGEYKNGTETVIVATGLDFHDALVAVPLASAYDAPLLLTTDKQVTKQTEAELARLKATKVIIVSTNGAVGSKVKAALAKYNPTMISGKNCFETAAKVAKALQKKAGKAPDTIFFATDSAFADALSASPVAAIKNAPIIYLKNKGSIDSATAAYLKSVKGKVKNAYIIGGNGVISNAMMKNVATALGLTVNKTVIRVAGKNRYETCVAVNKKFKSTLSSDGICVAKGLDFPDALAGGVFAAKTRQALFLADGKKLQDVQSSYLKGKNASKITVFGGVGAVPDDLVKLIAEASV